MPLERSLAEILGLHEDVVKNDIRKCIPATVTAVHLDRQTVDVQVAINNPIHDELGNTYTEPAPGLSDVPVGVIRGGGFLVWVPVAIGDSVLLIFSDLSCDVWRAGDGTPQDPGFVGKHTHDSPFAIPCVAPDIKMFASPASTYASGKVLIGYDLSDAQILVSQTDIELGSNATAKVAVHTLLDSLVNVLVASYSAAGPETGFAAFIAALQSWKTANWSGASPTVGSSIAKVQP